NPKSKIDSPPRALERLFAHPPGKKDQFARTHTRNLYPRGRPGECARFGLDHGGENLERVRAPLAGVAAEVLVSLAHRHGDHLGRDSGRDESRRMKLHVLRRDIEHVAMTDDLAICGFRIEFTPSATQG